MTDLSARLDTLFAPWNRSDAIGVAREDAVIYRRGFGMASLESPAPITPATKLRIGSTSKHFTALLALLLAEDGMLDLDVPIRMYLPELTGPGGEPSIRMLLQHRGGSRCYLDLGFIAHGDIIPPIGWMLETQVRQAGRNFAPGDAAIYSNGGYNLVSLAIERAGGASFEAQLQARLLAPLAMLDTASVPSDLIIVPGMATPHIPGDDGGWRRGIFPSPENRGEGAIVSTVDDMLRWMAHLRRRDTFGSAASWAQLTERSVFNDGSIGKYALGLMIETYRDLPILHHAGGVVGGTSQMLAFSAHGVDIVILCNGAPGAVVTRLAEQVADILLEDQLGPVADMIPACAEDALLGHWWSADTGFVYTLAEAEGTLRLSFCGMPGGAPVRPTPDGGGIVAIGSVSDIGLDLTSARTGGSLIVRFGGRSDGYHKLDPAGVDIRAFGASVQGRYRCDDADCTAEIRMTDDRITIAFQDPMGRWHADLVPQSDRVGIVATKFAGQPYAAALSFAADGFALNTQRTRRLAFRRMDTDR